MATNVTPIHPSVAAHVSLQSGEGRFRWLHARPGRGLAVLEAAAARRTATGAWVVSRDEVVDAGWFGPEVSGEASARLGDVALVARDRRRLHRTDRHRALRPRRPARLGHAGRGATSRSWPPSVRKDSR